MILAVAKTGTSRTMEIRLFASKTLCQMSMCSA